MLRRRLTVALSACVSATSTTKRFWTIGELTMQRASTMLMPGLGEGAREVLEQAVAVPGVDLQLDLERRLVVALPVDAHEALGVLAQRRRRSGSRRGGS